MRHFILLLFCTLITLRSTAFSQLPTSGTIETLQGKRSVTFEYDQNQRPLRVIYHDSTRTTTYSDFFYRKYGTTLVHPLFPRWYHKTKQIDSLDSDGNVFDTLELVRYDVVWSEIRGWRTWNRNPKSGDLELWFFAENRYDSIAPFQLTGMQRYTSQDTSFYDTLSYTIHDGRIDTIQSQSRTEVYHYDDKGGLQEIVIYSRSLNRPLKRYDRITLYEESIDPLYPAVLEYVHPSLFPNNNYRHLRIFFWDTKTNDWALEDELDYEYNADARPVRSSDLHYHTTYEYYPEGVIRQRLRYRNSDDSLMEIFKSTRSYEDGRPVFQTDSFMSEILIGDSDFRFERTWEFGYAPLAIQQSSRAAEHQLVCYPNPATAILNVTMPSPGTLRLIGIDGSTLLIKRAVSKETIDVSALPPGSYTVETEAPSGSREVTRFIKQ